MQFDRGHGHLALRILRIPKHFAHKEISGGSLRWYHTKGNATCVVAPGAPRNAKCTICFVPVCGL